MSIDAAPSDGPPPADLAACDREPIHQLGAIQPIGFLLAFTPDWQVVRASANVGDHIGRSAQELLGSTIDEVFGRDATHVLRNRLVFLHEDMVERVFGLALIADAPDRLFDCAVHRIGDAFVVEAEPSGYSDPQSVGTLIHAMVARLESATGLDEMLRLGARQMQALTGFDRVMVYRFDADGTGEVIAEVVQGGPTRFLGLHFPASDIPRQARSLYVRTPFRIIADVDATPVSIVADGDMADDPLDLSLSVLRAVSPVHIQYLRNMAVAASLSVSIIIDGRLWGLFACHHPAPRCPSFSERTVAELFGRIFALKLDACERQIESVLAAKARAASERLLAAVAADAGLLQNPGWIAQTIRPILACDGVGIWLDGSVARDGDAPSAEIVTAIVRQLGRMEANRVFATDHLSSLVAEADDDQVTAAGMLAIPLSRQRRDYVLLFRVEKRRRVMWAGDPNKPAIAQPGLPRLEPRASFEAWSEEVRGRSEPFTESEVAVAERLRVALIEIVLRLSEQAGDDRRRAAQHQELLIAELNHRVRNILALIRGLVHQSHQPDMPLASYIATLDTRLEALARAHDQITADNWGAARLHQLFESEATIYGSNVSERLTIVGDDIMLEPTAYSTMALVVHEMVTNSSKHGALSGNGQVSIDWSMTSDGFLAIDWRERGGPVVRAPTRQGFGTTIIQRSIPYELGGSVELRYPPEGLEASMLIPADHVRQVLARATSSAPTADHDAGADLEVAQRVLDGCAVLLVEDSLIIAMDAEDSLVRLGAARVATAASVGAALEKLAGSRPDITVLDVNLGRETSFAVADQLAALGVPFIFATGYGSQIQPPAAHVDVAVLQKPYTLSGLRSALAKLVDGRRPGR